MAIKELPSIAPTLLKQVNNLADTWGEYLTPGSLTLETNEIEPYHIGLRKMSIDNYQDLQISLRVAQQPTGTNFSFSLNYRDFSKQFPWIIWQLGLTRRCEFAYVANIVTDERSRGQGLASLAAHIFDGMLTVRAGDIDIPLLGYAVDETATGWSSAVLGGYGYASYPNEQGKIALLKIY